MFKLLRVISKDPSAALPPHSLTLALASCDSDASTLTAVSLTLVLYFSFSKSWALYFQAYACWSFSVRDIRSGCDLSSGAPEDPPNQFDLKLRRTSICRARRSPSKPPHSRPPAGIWFLGETAKKEVDEPEHVSQEPDDRDPCFHIPRRVPARPISFAGALPGRSLRSLTTGYSSTNGWHGTTNGHHSRASRISTSHWIERPRYGSKTTKRQ